MQISIYVPKKISQMLDYALSELNLKYVLYDANIN